MLDKTTNSKQIIFARNKAQNKETWINKTILTTDRLRESHQAISVGRL